MMMIMLLLLLLLLLLRCWLVPSGSSVLRELLLRLLSLLQARMRRQRRCGAENRDALERRDAGAQLRHARFHGVHLLEHRASVGR